MLSFFQLIIISAPAAATVLKTGLKPASCPQNAIQISSYDEDGASEAIQILLDSTSPTTSGGPQAPHPCFMM